MRRAGLLLVLLPTLILVQSCALATPPAPETKPAARPAPENVLFVGNSFSYYNNGLHHHFRQLRHAAAADGRARVRTRLATISGGYLPEHRGTLPVLLDGGGWDAVVLQGYSRGPIEPASAPAFRDAARDYAAQIRAAGAEPLFFMTWAYLSDPGMTSRLEDAYTSIGTELGARVVPVGLAFARVREERDDIALIHADDKHPTLAGTYLAACTFYAVLQQSSPVGNAYTAGLDDGVARYLQRIAAETVRDYLVANPPAPY